MKKVLITGVTVFVSRYIVEYYVKKEFDVFVLNRNTKEQSKRVTLFQAVRYDICDVLHFDMVIDTAYMRRGIKFLLDAIGKHDKNILINSRAVYPVSSKQPIKENHKIGLNKVWGKYGTDKTDAEKIYLK